MGHRRIIHILICGVMAALLSVACSKSSDSQGDEELTWYESIYFNITRSDDGVNVADNATYNFTLFGSTDGNTCYSGTYRLPEGDENTNILYPCAVDPDTGEIGDLGGEFDSSYGLTAPAGDYQIVVASPAVAVSSLSSDHMGNPRKGFKINRHLEDGAVDIFIKGPRYIPVSGVEIEGQQNYISSNIDLSRPRSKFALYVRSDDENDSYFVYDVYFDNVLETGYYNSTVGYYRGTDDVGTITPYSVFISAQGCIEATSTLTTMAVNSSDKTTIEGSDGVTINEAIYLIANNCEDGESTYVAVPHLVIELNRNGEDNKDEAEVVTIPLKYNFQRSYYYEFTITISPVGITLSGIEVEEWYDGGSSDIVVANLAPIIFEWDTIGNWDEGSGGETTFGETSN